MRVTLVALLLVSCVERSADGLPLPVSPWAEVAPPVPGVRCFVVGAWATVTCFAWRVDGGTPP